MAGKVDWFAAGLPSEGRAAELTRINALLYRDVPTCAIDDQVSEVRGRLDGDDVCLVVNDSRVVLGLVQGDDLDGHDDRPVGERMQEGPGTVRPNIRAAVFFIQAEDDLFAWQVVTTPEGELLGVLRGADLEGCATGDGADQVAAAREIHDHDHG